MSAPSVPVAIDRELTSYPSFELGYRPSLDGVRGIAILLVLTVHTNHLFGWSLLKGGSIGVDIFFVLSGFLITCILLEEWAATGSVNLRHFYVRRCLRLVPALILVLIALLLLSNFLFSPEEAAQTRRTAPIALVYLTDFFASLSPRNSTRRAASHVVARDGGAFLSSLATGSPVASEERFLKTGSVCTSQSHWLWQSAFIEHCCFSSLLHRPGLTTGSTLVSIHCSLVAPREWRSLGACFEE